MLKRITDFKFIFHLFAVSFVLIQPSKILSAMTGVKLFLAQFLVPLVIYLLSLVVKKEKVLRTHLYLLCAQVCVGLIHAFFAEVYINVYAVMFVATPHFILFLKHMYSVFPEDRFLVRTISLYVMVSFGLSVVAWYKSTYQVNFWTALSVIDLNLLTRGNTLDRYRILTSINYAYQIFKAPMTTLEGVALTVFPIVLLSLCYLRPRFLKDRLVLAGALCSLSYVLLKSSRGELLFLILLFSFPVARVLFSRIRLAAVALFAFGYVQLFLGKQALNGRDFLNELFLDNITLLGRGIGFSSNYILLKTKQDYSSFHNVHFDIITNYGVVLYTVFIGVAAFYVLAGSYDRARHYFLCLVFVLFATNYEIVDVYFAVPLGFLLSMATRPERSAADLGVRQFSITTPLPRRPRLDEI